MSEDSYGVTAGGDSKKYERADTGLYQVRIVNIKPVTKPPYGDKPAKDVFRFTMITTEVMDSANEPYWFNRDIGVKYVPTTEQKFQTYMTTLIIGIFGELITADEYLALTSKKFDFPLEPLYGRLFNAYVVYKPDPKGGDGFNNIDEGGGPFRPKGKYLDYDNIMTIFSPWWEQEKPERMAKMAQKASLAPGAQQAASSRPQQPVDEMDDPFETGQDHKASSGFDL